MGIYKFCVVLTITIINTGLHYLMILVYIDDFKQPGPPISEEKANLKSH